MQNYRKKDYRIIPRLIEEEQHKSALCRVPIYHCMKCSHAIRKDIIVNSEELSIDSNEILNIHVPYITCDKDIEVKTQPYTTQNAFCRKGNTEFINTCSNCKYGKSTVVVINDIDKKEHISKLQKKYNKKCSHFRIIYKCMNKLNGTNHYSISTHCCDHFKKKETI